LLITLCTLSPRNIGLTAKNLEVIKKLPEQLEILLILIKNNLPEESFSKCRTSFIIKLKKDILHFNEIHDIVNNKKDIYILKQFVEGLIILKHTKFFDFEQEVFI
jgi:hypothetical protein